MLREEFNWIQYGSKAFSSHGNMSRSYGLHRYFSFFKTSVVWFHPCDFRPLRSESLSSVFGQREW